MSTSIFVENGIIVNVADLRLVRVRDVSHTDYRIELYFKCVSERFDLAFFSEKDSRDRVFNQIQEKMLK